MKETLKTKELLLIVCLFKQVNHMKEVLVMSELKPTCGKLYVASRKSDSQVS